MARLMFNAALRIEGGQFDGFYRVVAVPSAADYVWIAFAGSRRDCVQRPPATEVAPGSLSTIARATVIAMEEQAQLVEVDLQTRGGPAKLDRMRRRHRARSDKRGSDLALLLDHAAICASLEKTGRLGKLVRDVAAVSGLHRATVYRIWARLCVEGFTEYALGLRYANCGGPGVPKPVSEKRRKAGRKTNRVRLGEPDRHPQRGVTQEDRTTVLNHYLRLMVPSKKLAVVYREVVEAAYIRRYEQIGDVRVPVPPEKGTFPSYDQFRQIVRTETSAYERARLGTTVGHYNRNMRGLQGHAYDNVAGPGYVFAIDSTIGDIHLRSSVNRHWIIGRPIVYVVVDVWSTAVVGFYACLEGPSWRTAKLALFSTFGDPRLVASFWGCEYVPVLDPGPSVPAMLLCDRGEYLSEGARNDCRILGLNSAFNPPRRPDWKGSVEVLHRITKDMQIQAFLPGAIDARRRELELRTDARESCLTLREYVAFLYRAFVRYNLFSDRRKRLTADMIAAGVHPSPAGLWRFGHQACISYEKLVHQEHLSAALLYRTTMAIRRDGNFVESLEYEGDLAAKQQWSTIARSSGGFERTALIFPGSASRVWVPDDEGLFEFRLRANAKTLPDTTLEEWRDSLAYASRDVSDLQYQRLCADLERAAFDKAMVKEARAATQVADLAATNRRPSVREARDFERGGRFEGAPHVPSQAETASEVDSTDPAENQVYEQAMDAVFARLNRRGEA